MGKKLTQGQRENARDVNYEFCTHNALTGKISASTLEGVAFLFKFLMLHFPIESKFHWNAIVETNIMNIVAVK